MAIDKAKLAAFSANVVEDEDDSIDEIPAPVPMQKQPPELAQPVVEKKKFRALVPLLESAAEEIEQRCDELDADTLIDPNLELAPDEVEILREGYDALPEDLRAEMKKALKGVSLKDAIGLGQHLEDEEMVSDADRVAGYLLRLSALDTAAANAGAKEEDPPQQNNGEGEGTRNGDNEIGNASAAELRD